MIIYMGQNNIIWEGCIRRVFGKGKYFFAMEKKQRRDRRKRFG